MSFRDAAKQATKHRKGGSKPAATALEVSNNFAAREQELAIYAGLYANDPAYKMGEGRKRDVKKILERLAHTSGGGSLLDVSTGRGEALNIARSAGFFPVLGTEAVEGLVKSDVILALGTALPFGDCEWDHVTCWDTLEHLIPEDVDQAIKELWRVTKKTLTISASTRPSKFNNRELHISARSELEWVATFHSTLGIAPTGGGYVGATPCWRFLKVDC